MPARIKTAARTTSRKFDAGPASDISAARRGYCAAHCGLYGADAQPIIHPPSKKDRMGTTTIPIGERRMCGVGSSVTCPPRWAVSSPSFSALQACDASCAVVETTNARYHLRPSVRSGVTPPILKAQQGLSMVFV